MNCPTVDKLSQYVDHLLLDDECATVQKHIHNCHECKRIVASFREEQQFIKETLQAPSLSDEFTNNVLDQLEPFEQKTERRKKLAGNE